MPVDDRVCLTCDHSWDMHPGLNLDLSVCGECIYEEDYDLRAYADMCTLEPPGAADTHARPGRLRVGVVRSLLRRRYRVDIEGPSGLRWATVTPPWNARESAEETAATVKADIGSMPLRALRQKYR